MLRVVNDHIELIAQVEQVLDYIASLPEQERRIINYDAQMTALENEIKRYQDLKIQPVFGHGGRCDQPRGIQGVPCRL